MPSITTNKLFYNALYPILLLGGSYNNTAPGVLLRDTQGIPPDFDFFKGPPTCVRNFMFNGRGQRERAYACAVEIQSDFFQSQGDIYL